MQGTGMSHGKPPRQLGTLAGQATQAPLQQRQQLGGQRLTMASMIGRVTMTGRASAALPVLLVGRGGEVRTCLGPACLWTPCRPANCISLN